MSWTSRHRATVNRCVPVCQCLMKPSGSSLSLETAVLSRVVGWIQLSPRYSGAQGASRYKRPTVFWVVKTMDSW